MRTFLRTAIVLLTLGPAPHTALAAWPHSPFANLPLCTATDDQMGQQIVPDGAGGAQAEAWDLRDAAGARVRAGLCFARLETAGRTKVRRATAMP